MPHQVHLVPVCNTLPRIWQELYLFSPEVWAAERAAFVGSACLTSLFVRAPLPMVPIGSGELIFLITSN